MIVAQIHQVWLLRKDKTYKLERAGEKGSICPKKLMMLSVH